MSYFKRLFLCLIVPLIMLFNLYCSQGSLSSIDAYERIKPLQDLPEPTPEHNLVVEIRNVADTGTSLRNRVTLFINDKEILLNKGVLGYNRDYSFHFKLRPGMYKIRAVYYAEFGWRLKKYKITTKNELVAIYPDKRTILSITLDKKLNGHLKNKNNYFDESYEALQKNLGLNNIPTHQNIRAYEGNKPTNQNDQNSDKDNNTPIKLRINTIPSDANVYINDILIGNSPVVTTVDRFENIIVRITKDKYYEKIKLLNADDFQNRSFYSVNFNLRRKRK